MYFGDSWLLVKNSLDDKIDFIIKNLPPYTNEKIFIGSEDDYVNAYDSMMLRIVELSSIEVSIINTEVPSHIYSTVLNLALSLDIDIISSFDKIHIAEKDIWRPVTNQIYLHLNGSDKIVKNIFEFYVGYGETKFHKIMNFCRLHNNLKINSRYIN